MVKQDNVFDDTFDDLMSDDINTERVDPITGEVFNIEEDFDNFQKDSSATRTIDSNSKEGYLEVPFDIMDETKSEGENLNIDDKIVIDLLRSKGINPDSIKVQDEESNEIKEIKFSELSKEEQLNVLNYQNDNDEVDFTDTEIEAIEFLRENQMSLNDLAKAIREKTIAEIQESQNEQVYEVDDFSDDELFIIDFKNKYGEDFTEDELLTALDKAKEHEDLYNKQMGKVRENFKEYERLGKEQAEQEKIAKEQEKENEYISQVVNVARSLNDMHDTVDMDDDDKEEVLSFMFDKLPTGESALEKSLKDPSTRYKVAWYIKNGDEVFKEIHRYYQGEIENLKKSITKPAQVKPEAFIKNTNQKQHTTQKSPRKLEDLYN